MCANVIHSNSDGDHVPLQVIELFSTLIMDNQHVGLLPQFQVKMLI